MMSNRRCLRQTFFPSRLRVRASLVVLVFAGLLGGCSQTAPTSGPVVAATRFIETYDEWAQDGYHGSIPDSLRSLVSSEMVDVLQSDQRWHVNGGVVQHGAVRVIDASLIESSDSDAVVRVELDATDVSVTAEGEPTYVDYSQPIVTLFSLEKDGEWRVVSTTAGD